MKIFVSQSQDIHTNLATDEALLRYEQTKEDILFIYRNKPTVVIGRNQNTYAEVNIDYAKEHNITIARRFSGGGAVYQDLGNVCFSFITNVGKTHSYESFLKPVTQFLQTLGLVAEFRGRNDILINGFKVSGNAQYKTKKRMCNHGTLLFDTDLSILSKALNVHKVKLASKAIKSVRQRVSNIKSLLACSFDTSVFLTKLVDFFCKNGFTPFKPTVQTLAKAKEIREKKVKWSWNYGKSPHFSLMHEKRYDAGLISVDLNVSDGFIKDIKIYGDFLAVSNTQLVVKALHGVKYKAEAIKKVLDNFVFADYFGGLTQQQIIDTILGRQ